MTQGTSDFSFTALMAQRARELAMSLDRDQQALVAQLDALGQRLLAQSAAPGKGLYVWGRTGRGKSLLVDSFFAGLPLAARRRVHFHSFFRELHQRLNAPTSPSLPEAIAQMTDGCRLICFDEFHLHDPADAMLVKPLLAQLFQRGVVLMATSNYPPERLLEDPLYHARFLPSIALIQQHMTVVALDGEEDYRTRHAPAESPFCQGLLLVQPSDHTRRRHALPEPVARALTLSVGYRTLEVASAPAAFLHFTFSQLCQGPTSVMDYLTLCESHSCWLLDAVPPLGHAGPAAQQRFINLVDVLYEKQCRLVLVSECGLPELVAGVEREDIQRTYSRLQQLRKE